VHSSHTIISQPVQTTASDYNAQKRTYETTAASFESAFANLEQVGVNTNYSMIKIQEVKSMRADVNEAESECFRLQVDKCVADAMLQRAMDGNFKQIIEVGPPYTYARNAGLYGLERYRQKRSGRCTTSYGAGERARGARGRQQADENVEGLCETNGGETQT
jgi:hypothetical protein